MNPLFGSLIVWYLFLGGAGSGAFVVSVLLDWAARRSGDRPNSALRKLAGLGESIGLATVLLGTVFLLADLGRIDRMYTLFTQPTFSAVSVGAYAILLFSVCAFYLIAVRHFSLREYSAQLTIGVEAASVVFAIVVMVYTGVLLAGMRAVALWSSPLIPVLFVLSSLSTGIAVVLVCALFFEMPPKAWETLKLVARIDAVVIGVEVVAFAAFLVIMLATPATADSVGLMLSGSLAETFWLGYVMCGLLLPLCIELFALHRYKPSTGVLLGVLILVGGFCLRYLIVNAGFHEPVIQVPRVLS
ncbi:MAG: NrfD/PsrC family molybdoenzyme membrane anchor subunit [Coriobacteriia bacterium]